MHIGWTTEQHNIWLLKARELHICRNASTLGKMFSSLLQSRQCQPTFSSNCYDTTTRAPAHNLAHSPAGNPPPSESQASIFPFHAVPLVFTPCLVLSSFASYWYSALVAQTSLSMTGCLIQDSNTLVQLENAQFVPARFLFIWQVQNFMLRIEKSPAVLLRAPHDRALYF